MKCTVAPSYVNGDLHFPLPIKNYNDLRPTDVLVPRILIVVVTHASTAKWIEVSPPDSTIRECGYWLSLRGMPPTSNTTSVTVTIPLGNKFTPNSLTALMTGIANGVAP